MKKQTLALLVAATLGLTGCGDDSSLSGTPTIGYETAIAESLKAPTKVNFKLQGPDANVPAPSFFLVDTFDGTLNIPVTGDANDLSNPIVAMNRTDGWSPNQPILIPFNGVALDPATLSSGVRVAKVPNPLATTAEASSAAVTTPSLLTFGVDYIVSLVGGQVAIVPLTALDEKTDYFYAITDALKDTNGDSVGMTESYASLKTKNSEPVAALLRAQTLVHGIEATMAGLGVTDEVIYSSWYTTGAVGDVVNATKGAIAQSLSGLAQGATLNDIWKGNANPNNKDLTGLYTLSLAPTGTDFATAVDDDAGLSAFLGDNAAAGKTAIKNTYAGYQQLGLNVDVYKGTLKLPSYLETSVENQAWKKTPFHAAMPSLAKLSNTLSTGSDADKAALGKQLAELGFDTSVLSSGDNTAILTEAAKLLGVTLTLANGTALDAERVITQYNPVPQIKDVVDIPVIMFVPQGVANPGVLLYQHGITSRKENSYLFAANHMAIALQAQQQPYAILAYDQPLHGERALSDGTVADDDNVAVFMNLEYLNVARDNLRQGALDTIGARTALTVMKGLGHPILDAVDLSNISIMGHSLGGITALAAYHGVTTSISPEADAVFTTQAGVFANPGGGIADLLLNSGAYGNTVKHSLLIASNVNYQAFQKSKCLDEDGQPTVTNEVCFSNFYSVLDDASKAAVDAGFASFAFAAQTVLDPVDPVNFAYNTEAPAYLIQSANDPVIPNSVAGSTTGGTAPTIARMALSKLTGTVAQQTTRVAAYFAPQDPITVGHSTVIAPNSTLTDAAVTQEMQTQIATFVTQKGQGVVVTNSAVMDTSTE
ncbi:VolA/Pla-1 family phospholipase [Thaumasiovibrio subtropicus]|uniref:VolA/Pla-1 family phospholipase n=1 Tax=Thaumasiovibrio subtropicus TaxID=1891207 RepID=UPI00131AEC17|nr:VolA/Pla-1 family phospholipase [Thaumasiovibrio subtropicus]